MHRILVLIIFLASITACSEDPRTGETGPRVAIEVLPLELDDVDNARYVITVSAGGETVWSQAVDSDTFGDGRGSLAYIGPCDASPDRQPNVVTLELEALVADGADIPADTWKNPTPVSREVTCEENRDALVRFDLTIMRDAIQGFFDIAVNFDDIFCSAKFDCQPELLHDGATRSLTGVLAFACAAGKGQATTLYLSDIVVTCDGLDPVTVDPSRGPGQQPADGAPLFGFATYWGEEGFPDVAKCYWNTALGLTLSTAAEAVNPANCQVVATGTATSAMLTENTTDDGARYPVIQWTAPLTDGSGRFVCEPHALDQSTGVTTRYTDVAGESFARAYPCGGRPSLSCAGQSPSIAGADVQVSDLGQGRVRVAVGDSDTTFELPAGASLVPEIGCCVAPCCQIPQ